MSRQRASRAHDTRVEENETGGSLGVWAGCSGHGNLYTKTWGHQGRAGSPSSRHGQELRPRGGSPCAFEDARIALSPAAQSFRWCQ